MPLRYHSSIAKDDEVTLPSAKTCGYDVISYFCHKIYFLSNLAIKTGGFLPYKIIKEIKIRLKGIGTMAIYFCAIRLIIPFSVWLY